MGNFYGNRPQTSPLSYKEPVRSYPQGTVGAFSDAERGADAVFSCVVEFHETPVDGCLFEMGGSGAGHYIGVIDGGTTLRLRAGDGSAKTTSDTITAVLDITDFPMDGSPHVVVWELKVAIGRVRLWIDGRLKGQAFTTGSGPLHGSGLWAGSNAGVYAATSSSIVVGEVGTGWSGEVHGDLYYYGQGGMV